MLQTILGANGTIGKILASELFAYTNQIRLVSRNPKKVNKTDELFPADLSDPNQVDKAIEGSEVVYLMVGFDYNIAVWRKNWPPLMKATIAACKKHKAKLVFFDNVYLYDAKAIGRMTEDSPINPPSQKGKVRQEIAEMLMKELKSGELKGLIARAPDFYGPENDKSFLNETVFKNLKNGKRPNWFIDANKIHSFIFTPDAAKATAILGNTEDAYGQVWHLPVDTRKFTGLQWIDLFNKEMKTDKKVMVMPMFLLKILGLFIPFLREMPEMMYQYNQDYIFDCSKFQARFNFKVTPNEEAVRQIVANGK
jgi:nucleoside-diphosphate-sugar epimerase